MKINSDHVCRLISAVKMLADMPFSVVVDTISKPMVQLFDEVDFDNTFQDYEVVDLENITYHVAKRDGIRFECIVRMEGDDD